jgi:glycosyltransferase involved in cell wall biosynthesis
MKILHILYESRHDYFGIGGAGLRMYEIYKSLRNDHEITLLCKKYPGAKDSEIEGLRHIFVGTESRSFLKTLLSYAYHASSFVKKYGENFDIIIQEFSPAIPILLHTYTKKPVVLQIQGYTGMQYFKKYNFFFAAVLCLFERYLPLFYRNIIFVSESSKSKFHIDGHKNTTIISNGIPEKLLKEESAEESDYILYLGRIDIHHKGLDILLTAYTDFYRIFPGIRLIIAGDGRDRQRFSELFQKLPPDIRQNIELKGWVAGDRKAELLRNALMVVVPSRYETQGIVVLEAMAYGKAVIVSDISELRYVTQCKAGMSFKTEDARSLAHAMESLLASDERKEMGRRGKRWVSAYTWDKMALSYERFLSGVLSGDAEGRKV